MQYDVSDPFIAHAWIWLVRLVCGCVRVIFVETLRQVCTDALALVWYGCFSNTSFLEVPIMCDSGSGWGFYIHLHVDSMVVVCDCKCVLVKAGEKLSGKWNFFLLTLNPWPWRRNTLRGNVVQERVQHSELYIYTHTGTFQTGACGGFFSGPTHMYCQNSYIQLETVQDLCLHGLLHVHVG